MSSKSSPGSHMAMQIGDKVTRALCAVFPGHGEIIGDGVNIYRDIDGERTYTGRGCELELIFDHAAIFVDCEFDGATITFKHYTGPAGGTLADESLWETRTLKIAVDDYPAQDAEDKHFQRNPARFLADFLAKAAFDLVGDTLAKQWEMYKQATKEFENEADVAALYANFHGDRIRFEHVKGCGPSAAYRIHNGGSSTRRVWLGDLPPVEGQECWAVLRPSFRVQNPGIFAVRLRRNDDYSHTFKGRYFVLDGLGGARPKFTNNHEILVPEGNLGEFRGGEDFMLIPRSKATDQMALALTTALDLLDKATDQCAVIEAAFGGVLKTVMNDAVAKVERAARAVAEAAVVVNDGPIENISDLLREG